MVSVKRSIVSAIRSNVFALVRHIGVAEARQIGSDDMETVGEQRDQVAEHVAGGREAVQQEQLRRARRARLAIENVAAVDLGGPIMDGGHDAFSFRLQFREGRLSP